MGLVRFKWNRYGRYVYYMNLLQYFIFLACLTVYIVIAPNPADYPHYYQDDKTCGRQDILLVVSLKQRIIFVASSTT